MPKGEGMDNKELRNPIYYYARALILPLGGTHIKLKFHQ
jgi:hypothetical protein